MDEEKILAELGKANKTVESFKTLLGEKIDKADMETLKSTLKQLADEFKTMSDEKVGDSVKVVKETLQKLATQVEEMQEFVAKAKDRNNMSIDESKSFGQIAIESLQKAGWGADGMRYTKAMGHTSAEFKASARQVLKVVASMGTANVLPTTGGGLIHELVAFESGLTNIARRKPWIMGIANVVPTTAMYVGYAEKKNPDGAAASTAEKIAKNQIDFDWQEVTKKIEKYTAFIKVSKEALSDLSGLRAEIDAELLEQVMLKVDSHLLDGDGVSPNISGLRNGDTAFSGAAFANSIISASKWDVLRVAISEVVSAQFIPNYVLMTPNDIAAMEMVKDSLGQYVLPPFKAANGMEISNVKVLGNTDQDADNFTVGDFTKLNVRLREDFMVDVGLDGEDFTKNLLTVLGEIRLASYIKSNHAGAFVSGDFATAIGVIGA